MINLHCDEMRCSAHSTSEVVLARPKRRIRRNGMKHSLMCLPTVQKIRIKTVLVIGEKIEPDEVRLQSTSPFLWHKVLGTEHILNSRQAGVSLSLLIFADYTFC